MRNPVLRISQEAHALWDHVTGGNSYHIPETNDSPLDSPKARQISYRQGCAGRL